MGCAASSASGSATPKGKGGGSGAADAEREARMQAALAARLAAKGGSARSHHKLSAAPSLSDLFHASPGPAARFPSSAPAGRVISPKLVTTKAGECNCCALGRAVAVHTTAHLAVHTAHNPHPHTSYRAVACRTICVNAPHLCMQPQLSVSPPHFCLVTWHVLRPQTVLLCLHHPVQECTPPVPSHPRPPAVDVASA